MIYGKKVALAALLAVSSQFVAAANGIRTAGDGTTYSFATLAKLDGSGISSTVSDGRTYYTLSCNDTIAAGDKFQLDDGVTVLLEQDVTFVVEGEADFRVTNETYFDSATDGDVLNANIRIAGQAGTTAEFAACSFNQVGVESTSAGALHLNDCTFTNHDGSNAAALYFITAGEKSVIEHCYFEECKKAAIGSAANASQDMTISECVLVGNSTANQNIPQINIAAAVLEITDCRIEGRPMSKTANNMVGGIGISNYFGYDNDIRISGCFIAENRYGIGTVGPTNIRIENNVLNNNDHEANAMNGGSGISLYDPYLQTVAVIARNHIEGNLWGVTVIGCKDVNLGQPASADVQSPGENVFINNGNNGQLYDLYNNSSNTIYAQNNTWFANVQTEEEIEKVIYHQHDDPTLGEVIFMPANPGTDGLMPAKTDASQGTVYDLQGRSVQIGSRGNSLQPRSIYIQNGRKVLR